MEETKHCRTGCRGVGWGGENNSICPLCILNFRKDRQLRMAVTLVYIEPGKAYDVKQLY